MSVVGPPEKRVISERLLGGGNTNSHYHYEWFCSACGRGISECPDEGGVEEAKQRAQARADGHKCPYGWSAVPITDERIMLAAISPYRFDFTVTADDRERWNRLRERNRARFT